MRAFSFTKTLMLAMFLIMSTCQAFAAGIPVPFRIGGTLTIDGVQKLQADTGIVVKVIKSDGTVYTDASGNPAQSTSLNASNWYLIDVPIYDATTQPGGAQTNDAAKIHVFLNGNELSVTSPAAGAFTVGASGATQQINLVADSNYILTPSAGTGGAISPSTPVTVASGATTSFTVTPATGYSISGVTGCGGTITGNTYTTGTISGNCSVTATFAINTFTVTPSAGVNGTISPSTPKAVNYNATTIFTVTPNTGYLINTVTGCGGTLVGSTYTTGAITAACSVAATFGNDDTTPPAFTSTSPASNSIINNSSVGYTLSEAVSSGKVTFTRTSGKADTGSPRIYTLSGSNLAVGSHTVNTNLSLVDGAFYTVSFDATDMAGYPATTVLNAMVFYDPNYGTGPSGNADNTGYSINRVDGFDLIKLSIAFGSKSGDANWNPVCDLDKNGNVDGNDLITLGAHFGEVQ